MKQRRIPASHTQFGAMAARRMYRKIMPLLCLASLVVMGAGAHGERAVAAPQPQGPWMVAAVATNTAWSGPWGVSYTANLTPDAETGLGKWTLRNFIDTIRGGRHLGRGRPVLPPMPIPMYRNFTDEDLEAIYSYLRTIPAVSNRVPEPLPPTDSAGR